MSSDIFGPGSSFSVKDSGESGHHYKTIVEAMDIFVAPHQQYVIHDVNYLDVVGSIEVSNDGDIIVEDE